MSITASVPPNGDRVIRLAAKGDGVTESGRFVNGVAPGDVVQDDGTIIAGPERTAPVCKHFGRCGGCQLQHVSEAAYRGYITDRIAEALRGQDIAVPHIHTPHLSPSHSRRRASLRAMKIGRRVVLGFAEAKSHHLIDLAMCPILDPKLYAMIAPLRSFLLNILRDKRPSDVRMTLSDQGVDLMISGVSIDGLAATEALASFAQDQALARLSVDEGYGAEPRWEPAPVTVTLSGVPVSLPEGAFLQATQDGEAALIKAVDAALTVPGPAVDLFAGLGTFALSRAGAVNAVEGARDAAAALLGAAKRSRPAMTVEHRDLFRRPVTAKELATTAGVIIDPPRAGAKDQIDELATCQVPVIASVSCNPATFARDAKLLIDGGYKLDWIQPVGQFLWSTHVELAARFSR
jgi:23S rRNA (uracil1939-C5)-methyltransferase